MDAAQSSPLVQLPASPAVRSSGWGHERLTDPRLARVWKKLAELRAAKVTVVMIVREFLWRRIAPLQRHSCPMWAFTGPQDPMRLSVDSLLPEVLDGMLHTLTDEEASEPPMGGLPLYRYRNKEALAGSMPCFD